MEQQSSSFGRFTSAPRGQSQQGFTLVEVLIVISIIAILAAMSFEGINIVRENTKIAQTTTDIASLTQAVDRYRTDEKIFPGMNQPDLTRDDNQFPILFNRLNGRPKPLGPGGRSAPYMKFVSERVKIEDEDWDEDDPDSDRWRDKSATTREKEDPEVDKYYLDAWRNAYIYRCNRPHKLSDWMLNPREYDVYSLGPDELDSTILGDEEDEEEGDDISNN